MMEYEDRRRVAMETRSGHSLSLLLPGPTHFHSDFNSLFTNLNTLLLPTVNGRRTTTNAHLRFSSTSVSLQAQIKNPGSPQNWLKHAPRDSPTVHALFKNLSVLERALVGAAAGGIAGAFTYVCLHPLDTIKTKLQTKGALKIYSATTVDAFVKTFQSKGILGFYNGVSAVIVGSTFSSAVYFGV